MNNNNLNIGLEKRITEIESRNKKVELDKAWETSWERRIIIAVLTYLVIVLFFIVNNFPHPWKNALVPTLGFLFSTLTLNLFKQLWINSHQK